MRVRLKGGILLAVYGVRRPTKDVDAEAIRTTVTPEVITQVIRDVAEVRVSDGLVFDLDTMNVREIRDQADYPGLRMRVTAYIGSQKTVVAWDISTGDPIVPSPQPVRVPRVLGGEIEMLGYAPETTVAEKGVTILERGIAGTRWRDFVDIVQLAAQHGLDEEGGVKSLKQHPRPGPPTTAYGPPLAVCRTPSTPEDGC